jgi:hypothetical protein
LLAWGKASITPGIRREAMAEGLKQLFIAQYSRGWTALLNRRVMKWPTISR